MPIRPIPSRPPRWLPIAAGVVVLVLLVLAAFPFGVLKGTLENRLSARIGRPVTIATLHRREWLSFSPTLLVEGVRVPQPAGFGSGDLAIVDAGSVTLPVLPLLIGRVRPRAITIDHGQITLIRTADGRTNLGGGGGSDGGTSMPLTDLRIRALDLHYRDAKRDRSADVTLAAGRRGVRVVGTGLVQGAAVRIAASGPGIAAGAGKPWPFQVALAGDRLNMTAIGTMAAPLDTKHMRLAVQARADDLRRIDAVIEAGLFGTDDVTLAADVERTPDSWIVRRLHGRVGASPFSGRITATRGERNRLDGAVTFERLDFADLSSDEGNARGAALERRIGPRLIPNTQLDLAKLGRTDGRIAITVKRIFSAAPTPLAWTKAVLTIDRQRLTIAPFALGLDHGRITGRITVDQRGGATVPTMRFDLSVRGTSLGTLATAAPSEGIDAPVDGRIRLSGRGRTIRAAVGASDGRIGLVARGGVLPNRIAAGLGFDVGGVLTSGQERARLRCGILGLDVRHGVGRVDPLLIDTDRSVARGTGTVRFPDESVAMSLTGAPKRGSLLRLDGAVLVSGTIRVPRAQVPPKVKSAGNVFRMIGRAITGRQEPLAPDVDCAGQAARVLR